MDTVKAVWIAGGDSNFIGEAHVSSVSFRRHNPDIPRVLITYNDISSDDNFEEIIHVKRDSSIPWYLNAVRYCQLLPEIADKILLFDTDTYICASLGGAINLLDRFDFLGCHAPGRRTTGTIHKEIDGEFPEINIGFLAIDMNGSAIEAFLEHWLYLYENNVDVYCNNDQGSLRDALLDIPISFYVLPTEYNFRFQFGGQVRGIVRVLHGRCKSIENAARRINSTKDIRAYHKGEF